jgi:acetylornithine/N-succinyldiaminopimelate aminotransferase
MSLMNTYPPHGTVFVRGDGTLLFDDAEKRYLDFLGGLAVVSMGHSRPEIVAALQAQAEQLWHVSNLFGTLPGPVLAGMLDELLGGDGKIFFTNSGAEANECAIKVARKYGGYGKHTVVSAFASFHGRTLATLHATGQPAKHEAFQPLPEGFKHAEWNDVDDFARVLDPTVAAIFVEPLQGEGGVNMAEHKFMADLAVLCQERGVLLMLDEVQTGLGRTGEWFGFQHYGINPDVVTMAKALGNGMPIGACWARGEAGEAFIPGDHGTTYGGQPLAAAAALATVRLMKELDAPALARKAGGYLSSKVSAVDGVSDVRGLGLLLASELTSEALAGRTAPQIAAACLEAGLVVNGVTPTSVRWAPPLTVSEAEIDEAVQIFASVLNGGT